MIQEKKRRKLTLQLVEKKKLNQKEMRKEMLGEFHSWENKDENVVSY